MMIKKVLLALLIALVIFVLAAGSVFSLRLAFGGEL